MNHILKWINQILKWISQIWKYWDSSIYQIVWFIQLQLNWYQNNIDIDISWCMC